MYNLIKKIYVQIFLTVVVQNYQHLKEIISKEQGNGFM